MDSLRLGVIGAGNMGGAILRGLAAAGAPGDGIAVYDRNAGVLDKLQQECGIRPAVSAADALTYADAVLLAVKPQVLPAVLPEIAPLLTERKPLVISIVAGKTLEWLEDRLGSDLPLVRVMPNLAAKAGAGMAAFCGNAAASASHKQTVRRIFGAVGEVMELEESLFSGYSAIAGCSPAFTLLYIDALAEAGVRYGIPKAAALTIASQAVLGTARLLQQSGEHPRVLADQVCSPGGTTIEGVAALQENGFEAAVLRAVRASFEKDRQL